MPTKIKVRYTEDERYPDYDFVDYFTCSYAVEIDKDLHDRFVKAKKEYDEVSDLVEKAIHEYEDNPPTEEE